MGSAGSDHAASAYMSDAVDMVLLLWSLAESLLPTHGFYTSFQIWQRELAFV